MYRPRIGLALGSGGPKGIAHIGVIKVLEENNIQIDYISGSSAGSIAGSFYAAHKNSAEIEEYILNKNWFEMLSIFLDPSFKQGVLRGNKLKSFLTNYLHDITFDKLKIPLRVVSVDLLTGLPHISDSGKVADAVLASCGMPFLFSPVVCNECLLADGGLYTPVPTKIVRNMGADIVVAVDLYSLGFPSEEDKQFSMTNVVERSISIMMARLAEHDIESADLVIKPQVSDMKWRDVLDRSHREYAIQQGTNSMRAALPKLKNLIDKQSRKPVYYHFFRSIKRLLHRYVW